MFNIIVGFPGEPFSSVQDSFAAARGLRAMSPKFEVPIFYYWPYPGNEIAESLARDGYQFPSTLQAWANFDFVVGAGPWVDEAKYRLVERFKFYQKHGYGPSPHLACWPLRAASRLRVRTGWFGLPFEKALVEKIRPPQTVS